MANQRAPPTQPPVIGPAPSDGPVYQILPNSDLQELFDQFTGNRTRIVRIYYNGRPRKYRATAQELRTIVTEFIGSVGKYKLLGRIPERYRTTVVLDRIADRQWAMAHSPFAIQVLAE